ncbi:hypothetical protein GCG54_00013835 [Colletotrichum gloeosporioides]|uniref:Uncharacterized protein n=1 Tax=Colletotrichum gloeosporioides TaxID=474922 RepID=A0A8H4CV10_COLGL|nr:uncharacterized protein GCG54_00013835 [Colletotrichum gloeosporioides]KAF3810593.1 hypothetical protein GCG54_00013835 [Colletotrichum gloeosporioides]
MVVCDLGHNLPIVFPGIERLSSLHPDLGMETEIAAFREYRREHKRGIIENLLNSVIADPSISEDRQKQLARTMLVEGLDYITALQTLATFLGDSALSAGNLSGNNLAHPGLFTASNSVSDASQLQSSSDTLSCVDKPELL